MRDRWRVGEASREDKRGHMLSMLGVYLMELYIIGIALALLLFGYGNNLTPIKIIAGLILIFAVGLVGALVITKKILEVCGEYNEKTAQQEVTSNA